MPGRRQALGLTDRGEEVQVRQQPVRDAHRARAGEESDERRPPLHEPHLLRQGNGRREERPEGRRDHHPGGEPERGIEKAPVHGLEEEDDRGPDRGHPPGEERGQQCLRDRTEAGKPVGHAAYLTASSIFKTSSPSQFVCGSNAITFAF